MRHLFAAALLLPAAAAPAQTAQGDVSVTIYNNNQALVQDVRNLTLPAGRSRQEFADVSALIRPETVSLSGAEIAIVEQNFDFDLLTPDKLMEKAVGRDIVIVRTNPATGAETRETARVLAANGGIVLQVGGRIEVLRDDGLPVRVIFDKVPENLRARPTLSVTIESGKAGVRPAALSYLTQGLGWSADYVALFDEKAQTIDVQGWVTLTNNAGTTFANANTLLVAGDTEGGRQQRGRGAIRTPGTESAAREQLGDFYLYPLKARTTIANRQTKQVSFLDVSGAAAKKAYEYRNGWLDSQAEAVSAASVLKFSSAAQGGLGDALPAGTVRVYMRDQRGNPQFIGENSIPHTPMGSELAIKTGDAFDVKVKATVETRSKLGQTRWRTAMRYVVSNARAEPVTVDVRQDGLDWVYMDTKIAAESLKGERVSSDAALWHVPVPANGEAALTVTFDTRY